MRLLGGFQRLGQCGLAGVLADQLLDEGVYLALGNGSHEPVGGLAVLEGNHRRYRLDAELSGNRRVIVDVHLDQFHAAAGCRHRALERRLQLLAGAAPGRPEVDQHRLVARFLDDVGGKARGRRVLDRRGGRGGTVWRGLSRGAIADILGILTAHTAERVFVAAHNIPSGARGGSGPARVGTLAQFT